MMIANSNGLVNTGEVDAKRRKEIEKGEGKKERKGWKEMKIKI